MNVRGARQTGLILIAALLLSACGDDLDLGPVRTETRDMGRFDSISMNGAARLEITIGDRESLSIEGRDEVISRFTTDVHGDTLYIKSRRKDWIAAGSSSPRVTVRITLPRLDSLKLEGGNDVRLTGFAGGKSKIQTEGAAHIKADGRLDELTVLMAGAGHADLGDLIADEAKIMVSGVGSVFVHPLNTLDATMNGVGAILYTGNPREVNTHMNGLGTIGRREPANERGPQQDDDGATDKEHPVDPDSLQPEYEDQKQPAGAMTEVI